MFEIVHFGLAKPRVGKTSLPTICFYLKPTQSKRASPWVLIQPRDLPSLAHIRPNFGPYSLKSQPVSFTLGLTLCLLCILAWGLLSLPRPCFTRLDNLTLREQNVYVLSPMADKLSTRGHFKIETLYNRDVRDRSQPTQYRKA